MNLWNAEVQSAQERECEEYHVVWEALEILKKSQIGK